MEEYRKLGEEQKGGVVVVMLTTSLNPADRQLAEKIPEINDFKNKAVSVEMLEEIIASYLTKPVDQSKIEEFIKELAA